MLLFLLTSPLDTLMPRKMSPKEPDPIFLMSLYLPPTMNSVLLSTPKIDMTAAVRLAAEGERDREETQLPRDRTRRAATTTTGNAARHKEGRAQHRGWPSSLELLWPASLLLLRCCSACLRRHERAHSSAWDPK